MGNFSHEKVLITGASGMIGAAFSSGIKLGRKDLDVTDPSAIKTVFKKHKPSAVIHLANLDLRQCQKDPYLALKTNVGATRDLMRIAREGHIPIVFVSSGSVFNGKMGSAFDEDATPEPLNFYAAAKVISEEILLDQYSDGAIIIRTGWVFGGHGAHHRKFVDTVIERAKLNDPIFAATENDGSPTYVNDLVAKMSEILAGKKRGIFHVVNSGAATPFAIAEHVVRELGSRSKIAPYIPNPQEAAIPRSACEVMTSKHFQLRPWREALSEYLREKT